ncbi:hypothetical protein F0562_001164 [Nyssa sinensis]|uniref:Transcription factor Iwr1 domain-containing protein n=1 Tax=Nyssa sinensis TaxID=561372 RepID=A0A5J5C694_9ASTE|nr:hypothetical protein F0562_001164 [Nyssa sinensis]
MHDETVHEMCHLYDVVRVDVEETTNVVQEQEETELEDHRIMCNYLPLLKEFIPSAAAEVESDIHAYMYKRASRDDYVYDFYAVEDCVSVTEDTPNQLPLVQVDDDDGFYDGPVESEFESDDSNAEDNPMNDYPDEETSEDEEEVESITSNDESEELDTASASGKSPEHGDLIQQDLSEDSQSLYEDEIYGDDDGDGDAYDYEGGYDDDWR